MRSVVMEVSEVLKKAWTAVEGAGLPEKIHETTPNVLGRWRRF